MAKGKVAVTIDEQLLHEVDRWVATGEFASRSRAVQTALELLRDKRTRRDSLLAELVKLDPDEERGWAAETLGAEAAWPPY